MKTLSRLVGLGGGSALYLFAIAQPDPYHYIATGSAVLLIAIFAILMQFRDERNIKTAIAESDQSEDEVRAAYDESGFASIAWLIGFLCAVIGIASLFSFVGRYTPVYDMFYDRQYESFKHDLSLTADPEKEIGMIDARLAEMADMPQKQKEELINTKYDLLVQWGVDLRQTDEVAAKAKWREAVEWANENGLKPDLAQSYIDGTKPAIIVTPTPTLVAPPRNLPVGSVVEVPNSYADTNTLFLDVNIRQPNGEYVGDLLPTDFEIWCNGELVLPHFIAVESYRNLVSDRYVDFVVDASGSMGSQDGLPMQNAKLGASVVIKTLRPNDRVRLIVIASKVEKVTEWLTPDEALAEVANLQAVKGGSTAFWDGMKVATTNVPSGGPHLIIGLTDGADNASAANPDELLKVYSGSKSSVILVAITSDQFRPDQLQSFAQAVNGQFLTASAQDLVSAFDSIAKQTASQYRVTVFLPGQNVTSFKVKVGDSQPVEKILP